MLKSILRIFEISRLEVALENMLWKLRTFILVNNKPKFKYILDVCLFYILLYQLTF